VSLRLYEACVQFANQLLVLGGAPDTKRFTGDRFSEGFIGCIHVVEPLEGGAIQLGARTISSMNVDACPA